MVPDRWLAIRVHRVPDVDPEVVTEILLALGGRGVVEEPAGLLTYFPEPEDPRAFLADVSLRLTGEPGPPPEDLLHWWWQPHEDWRETWKKGLVPREITPRILVRPSWEPVQPRPGQVVLTVDPGMAFGTAEHGTTRGCLRLLDAVVTPGDHVLDVGAGSAILSIAAALLGAGRVLALEMDPLACPAARENVELNGVEGRVTVLEELVTPSRLIELGPVDGVVANIESGILTTLMAGFAGACRDGGWVILSGILLTEREDVLRSAGSEGLILEAGDADGEWWSGCFRRRPAGKART
jgi:ribosomal protein L11 methyltransferase